MDQSSSHIPEITLVHATPHEQQTKYQLLQLFEHYCLDKWFYTESIQIDRDALPHSHPVLTIHTRHLGDAQQLLSTYIHEQIHWFLTLVEHAERAQKASDTFHSMYPQLPIGFPDGCQDEFSNSLHVLVNYLEYLGLIELFGEETARQILKQKTYYKRIYELVLGESEGVSEVITRHGLLLPEKPPVPKNFLLLDHEP